MSDERAAALPPELAQGRPRDVERCRARRCRRPGRRSRPARPRTGRRRPPRRCAPRRRPGRTAAPRRPAPAATADSSATSATTVTTWAPAARHSAADRLERVRGPRGQHQPGAAAGQRCGGGPADPAGGAGHDDDQAVGQGPRHGLQHHLHAAVLLLLEDLVAVRRLVQRQLVGGQVQRAERVGVVEDQRQDVVDPALDVALAHPQLDAAVEHLHHRHRVDLAAVDAADSETVPPRRTALSAVCSASSRSIASRSVSGCASASGSRPTAACAALPAERRAVRLHADGVDDARPGRGRRSARSAPRRRRRRRRMSSVSTPCRAAICEPLGHRGRRR